MTKRTIVVGESPTVIIRAGGWARIEGIEGNQIVATTESRWGLKLERRGSNIEIEAGGSCTVRVPFSSEIKVYTGKDAEIFDIRNRIAIASVGGHLTIERSNRLAYAQSGRSMKIDCKEFESDKIKLEAGGSIRCHIANLANTRVIIQDLLGRWEVGFGSKQRILRLTSVSDVILVVDQTPDELPEVLGQIEVQEQPK